MSFEVEATYTNGVLKLDAPLPLKENERLTIRIVPKTSRVQESYGRIGWTGDLETLRKIAEDDEIMESHLSRSRQSSGLIKWTGDREILRLIAEDPELDGLGWP